MNFRGAGLAAVVTILWFIVFYGKRQYFSGIIVQRAWSKWRRKRERTMKSTIRSACSLKNSKLFSSRAWHA